MLSSDVVDKAIFCCAQLVQEFRQETLVERKLKGSGGDDPASMLTLRRGSEMVPESKTLPKMSLEDFTLLVVLGKGSFGKVCHHCVTTIHTTTHIISTHAHLHNKLYLLSL